MSNERVAKRLSELEREGRLLPADVVDDARDADSPLHSHFEWDDSIAAEHYRLDQARNLIRSIKIHVTVREMPVSVVAYVRDPELQDTPTAGYRNVILMRSEEDNARAVIVEEMKRVSYATQRAKSLAAVFGLTTEIDHIATLAHSVAERAASAAPAASA